MSESWWRAGVIYHIYPRSFQDSNGDGVGDLEGIRRRLDYFDWLGVDAIWISPFYPSPMHDFGYDVADYCGVDPIFGSLEVIRLRSSPTPMRAASKSSSTSCRTIPRSSIPGSTRAARGRGTSATGISGATARLRAVRPTIGSAHFGGRAWTFDAASGQYYHHAFLPEQPDLNWRNPKVREAMFDVLRFWLRRGADGFRVDVITHLMKDEALRDNPQNPAWTSTRPEYERLLAHAFRRSSARCTR